MPVDIHGKMYVTVAERIQALHEEIKDKMVSITTEFLPVDDMVVCRATVKIGENIFTGTSAANPSKAIEKQSPYEVAETSAVGRALGFAGFGIVEGIASADEMVKATYSDERVEKAMANAKPDVYERAMESQTCKKCGGKMVRNPKTGSYFCENKCWLKG